MHEDKCDNEHVLMLIKSIVYLLNKHGLMKRYMLKLIKPYYLKIKSEVTYSWYRYMVCQPLYLSIFLGFHPGISNV